VARWEEFAVLEIAEEAELPASTIWCRAVILELELPAQKREAGSTLAVGDAESRKFDFWLDC
jgi:hypothetical protein